MFVVSRIVKIAGVLMPPTLFFMLAAFPHIFGERKL
jgi:hypothetical protein